MQSSLVLAFQITPIFEEKIKQVNSHLLAAFISGGPYLERFIWEETHFLGKRIETPCDFIHLEELNRHIVSLLKRLSPDFPFENHPLLLFSIIFI